MSALRRRLRALYAPGGFRGPVLTLLSGTTLTLGLAYLAQPILTRLYGPDAFGVADYFTALMAVLISFTSLRYEDALMVPEDDDEASSVLGLSVVLLLLFAAAFLLLLPWRHEVALFLGIPRLAPWLPLIPPTLLAMRAGKLAETWLIRRKRFGDVSAGLVVGPAVMLAVRLGAGMPAFRAGTGGLIGGFFAGQVASLLMLGAAALRESGPVLRRAFNLRRMGEAAGRYRRFPFYTMPASLLGALLSRLPILLLPLFFDVTAVGFFGRAFGALAVPLSLVGEAVARVFFVQAAEAHRADRLAEVTATVHRRLVMLGLFPTLALLVAGPDVFGVVFGEVWRPAGVYVQRLGPWLFLAAVASPLTRLFDVLERQRLDLATSLLMTAVLAAALVAGGRKGDLDLTLLLLGASGAAARLLHLVVLLRLGRVPAAVALRPYGRYALLGAPGLLLIAGSLLAHDAGLTTLAVAAGGLTYAGLVLWRDRLLA